MIRSFKGLRGGQYIADFRFNEGVRVREEFISPTLTKSLRDDNTSISNMLILIEVDDES